MRLPSLALLVAAPLFAQEDPVLKFSRQVPKAEFLYVVSDGRGDVFALGRSNDASFAVPRSAAQTRLAGGYDVVVAKFRGSDGELITATFLGGSGQDVPTAIALDPQGFVYIGGTTTSRNFPATEGAVHNTAPTAATNGFVAKFNNSLTGVVFSTYLGGAAITRVTGVGTDRLGNAYVTGTTDARNFVTTAGAFNTVGANGMAFVTKLSATGTTRVFSTFVGVATPVGIVSDVDGNSIIAGNVNVAGYPVTADALQSTLNRAGTLDLFITKINTLGALQYSTLLGGPSTEQVSELTSDAAGNLYLGGVTYSTEAGSGFVTKFAAGKVEWTRQLNANGTTSVGSLEIDSAGNVLATGTTAGTHFPTTAGAYQRCVPGGAQLGLKPFYARLAADGAVRYSTFLAETVSSPRWAATLPAGDVVTMSLMPTPFEQAPNLVRRYVFTDASPARLDCAVNAASYRTVAVTPGMAVTVFGAGMGPAEGVVATLENGKVPTSVGGARVLFNGVPAPLLFVREDQINALVPFAMEGTPTAQVRIEYAGRTLGPLTLNVKVADPGVFRIGSTEFGAILNQDNTLNTAENAAARGSIITFWTTGMGLFENTYEDGAIIGENASLLRSPVRVTFFGIEGQVLYAGAAPGMVAGIAQLNVRVPANARVSNRTPISLSAGDTTVGDVGYVSIR